MLDDLLEAFGKKRKKHKVKKAKYPYGKLKAKKGWDGYGYGPGPASGYGPGPGHGYGPSRQGRSMLDKGLRLLVDKLIERAGVHPDRRRQHGYGGHHDPRYGHGYGPWRGHGAPFGKRRHRDWDDD